MTDLGNRLKETRLEKGMSLDDLQTATKIQKRYLVGIEEGNYSVMPGKFYVRAFIKQYAEALGLDPEQVFEEYKADIPATMNDDIPEKLSRVQSRGSISGGASKFFELLPKILIGVFIVGVVAVLYYFIEQFAGNNAKEPVQNENNPTVNVENNLPEEAEKPADEEESETGTDAPDEEKESEEEKPSVPVQEVAVLETNGSKTVFELKNTNKFVIKLAAKGDTWVNIKNGKGYSFFQGMLSTGGKQSEEVDLTNETEAVLKIGNATATELFVNDEKVEFAVSPTDFVTQDITIRFTPNE